MKITERLHSLLVAPEVIQFSLGKSDKKPLGFLQVLVLSLISKPGKST
jgi:hypothetical protein